MPAGPSALEDKDLTRSQARQLELLMGKILEALDLSINPPPDARPNNVFCIDGGRGSGKTYCLLTLEKLLGQLRKFDRGDPSHKSWDRVLGSQRRGIDALVDKKKRATLVQPLRVIFPGDLERQETVLEMIFAGVRSDLEAALEQCKDDAARKKEGEDLRRRLINEVGSAWSFARRFGTDAVVRNSLNYQDLVERWDNLNKLAAQRVQGWRDFVCGYLKWRGIECLTILLDDTDLRPEMTYDILHTARTTLNDPRIITVIAGNASSMRRSLLLLGMRELGPAMQALNQQPHPTAEEWRRSERIEVEQLMDKVLPASRRFFIVRSGAKRDFRTITGQRLADHGENDKGRTLIEACEEVLDDRRPEFIRIKMLRGVNYEIDGRDSPNPRQADGLQDYLAWWVFRSRYADSLGPGTPRQINVFADYYLPHGFVPKTRPEEAHREQKERHKRLPVMLFSNPLNYALTQRFGDEDPNVIGWLKRQEVKSNWIGNRNFQINGRAISEGTYSYDYLCYRLDIGLAQPLRHNSEAYVPEGMLPWVNGRLRMRPFFLPRAMPKRMRRLGIARWLQHGAIPANCIYFDDLSAIPDVFFMPRKEKPTGLEGAEWEAKLWSRWPALLDVDRNDVMQRYVTEVVFKRLQNAGAIRTTTLVEALEPPEHVKVKIPYQSFISAEFYTLDPALYTLQHFEMVCEEMKETGLRPLVRDGTTAAQTELRTKPADGGPMNDIHFQSLSRIVARYTAISTDLRRGWAAIRIYRNALDTAGREAEDDKTDRISDLRRPETTSLTRQIDNSERMSLYPLSEFQKVLAWDPWVKTLLDRCSRENLKLLIGKAGLGAGSEAFNLFEDGAFSPENQPVQSRAWVAGWRQVGRLLCDGWFLGPDLEDDFFGDGGRDSGLVLFGNDKGERQPNAKGNWRAARALAWFLYGVSSSLPAIVHADLMSRVHRLYYLGAFEKPPTQENALLIEGARKGLDETIVGWKDLLIKVTALERYVKMKNLHLYCVMTAKAVADHEARLDDERKRQPQDAEELELLLAHLSEERVALLEEKIVERVGGDPAGCETDVVPEEVSKLRTAWRRGSFWRDLENLLSGGHKLITNSHMMPDTSPSTLFGDNWLTDVVARLLGHDQSTSATDDGAGDGDGEGVSYGGVFGETERWLWAAHYMVRTAELVLRDTEKGIFESAPAPPSPKRQLPAEQTPAPPDAATP